MRSSADYESTFYLVISKLDNFELLIEEFVDSCRDYKY